MPSVSPIEKVGKYISPKEWNALISDPDTVSLQINISKSHIYYLADQLYQPKLYLTLFLIFIVEVIMFYNSSNSLCFFKFVKILKLVPYMELKYAKRLRLDFKLFKDMYSSRAF